MARRIYRYEVPVDDQWHEIELWGNPLAVNCKRLDLVEFWAWAYDPDEALPAGPAARARFFRAYGTGQPFDDDLRYWGTAIPPGRAVIWHLMEQR